MSVVHVVIDETAGIVHETTLIVWTDRIWESRRELSYSQATLYEPDRRFRGGWFHNVSVDLQGSK